MEPIPLEVDYDEDELSVSDPQAETTQAAHSDFPPSKVCGDNFPLLLINLISLFNFNIFCFIQTTITAPSQF